MNINSPEIVNYIRSIIPERNENIKNMIKYATDNNVPIIQPEVAQFLKVLISIKKPSQILELGTAIGYSSIVMATAMGNKGNVATVERNESMVKIASNNIKNNKLDHRIKIYEGDALEVLKNIEGKFDIIFLDAAKSKYKEFLSLCINKLNKEGLIISDNVLFKGMIAENSIVPKRKRTIVRNMREYLTYISNNEKFETTVIPIGDGVAITYVKEE